MKKVNELLNEIETLQKECVEKIKSIITKNGGFIRTDACAQVTSAVPISLYVYRYNSNSVEEFEIKAMTIFNGDVVCYIGPPNVTIEDRTNEELLAELEDDNSDNWEMLEGDFVFTYQACVEILNLISEYVDVID